MKKLTRISNLNLTDWTGEVKHHKGRYSIFLNSFSMPVTTEQVQELQFLSAIQCRGFYKIGEFITPYFSEHDLNPAILGNIKVYERDFILTLFLDEYSQGNITIELWNDFVDNFKIELLDLPQDDGTIQVIRFSFHDFHRYMLDGVMYTPESL